MVVQPSPAEVGWRVKHALDVADHLRLLGQDVTETERADQNNPTTAAAMVAAEKPTTMATKYATISSRALACQCLPLFQPSQILNTRPTPLLVWRGAAQRRVRSQPQLRVVWYHSLVRCCTGLNAGCMRLILHAGALPNRTTIQLNSMLRELKFRDDAPPTMETLSARDWLFLLSPWFAFLCLIIWDTREKRAWRTKLREPLTVFTAIFRLKTFSAFKTD